MARAGALLFQEDVSVRLRNVHHLACSSTLECVVISNQTVGMSRTPPGSVRTRTFERTESSREFSNPIRYNGRERSKSKVLITTANMHVNVIKQVWGPGSCPRGHISMQKELLKTNVFSGAVILMMHKVKKKGEIFL